MSRTRLERKGSDSIEFWEIALAGCSHMISCGRDGQELSTVKQDFDLQSACVASIQRRVAAQLRKGFDNVGAKPSPLWLALKRDD